jgi:hypothetical protein
MNQREREIRERVEKATAGPWRQSESDDESGYWWFRPNWNLYPACVVVSPSDECAVAATNDDGLSTEQEAWNAAFIAHAREDIPYLLDQLTAFQHAVKEWKTLGEAFDAGGWRDEDFDRQLAALRASVLKLRALVDPSSQEQP